jgi:hypothetical protein
VPGVVLLGVSVWIVATRAGVLLANHPAYPITLAVTIVVAVLLVITGLTTRTPPRGGIGRALLRWAAAGVGLLVAAALAWAAPFPATSPALDAMASDEAITVTDTRTSTTFAPLSPDPGDSADDTDPTDTTSAGFILYPGARVDPRAYAALARDIAAQGHRVVVLKCPFDIALLCLSDAEDFLDDARAWAVGGHSLGGVAASQFAADPRNGVTGLVFWASYPVDNLSDRDTPDDPLAVVSISGSEDGLSTPDDIADSRANLPASTEFVEIDGATHAFFGDYGEQPGDGTPTVDRATAQQQIVASTVQLLQQLD